MGKRRRPEATSAPSPSARHGLEQHLQHRQDHLPNRPTMWDRTEGTIPLASPSPCAFVHAVTQQLCRSLTGAACAVASYPSSEKDAVFWAGVPFSLLAQELGGLGACKYTDAATGTAWSDEEMRLWQKGGRAVSIRRPGKGHSKEKAEPTEPAQGHPERAGLQRGVSGTTAQGPRLRVTSQGLLLRLEGDDWPRSCTAS